MSTALALYHYCIPFRAPFRNAKGVFHLREGVILGNDRDIWCEIAPLPGFSPETLSDVQNWLVSNLGHIQKHFAAGTLDNFLSDEKLRPELDSMPSIRFGLSMLSEQQKSLSAGLPLYKWWRNNEGFIPAGRMTTQERKTQSSSVDDMAGHSIHNNAVFGLIPYESLLLKLREAQNNGFSTAKLKLPPVLEDARILIWRICNAFPDMMFRFDANGAFSTDEAVQLFYDPVFEGFIPRNLEYIEEPVCDPDIESFVHLRKHGIPVAADESVRTAGQARRLIANGAVDALIIKPMMFGSFPEILEVISQQDVKSPAHTGYSIIISSSFETGIGLTLAAHLAACFNTTRYRTHGLATGNILTHDILFCPESTQRILSARSVAECAVPKIMLPDISGIMERSMRFLPCSRFAGNFSETEDHSGNVEMPEAENSSDGLITLIAKFGL